MHLSRFRFSDDSNDACPVLSSSPNTTVLEPVLVVAPYLPFLDDAPLPDAPDQGGGGPGPGWYFNGLPVLVGPFSNSAVD